MYLQILEKEGKIQLTQEDKKIIDKAHDLFVRTYSKYSGMDTFGQINKGKIVDTEIETKLKDILTILTYFKEKKVL